MFLFGGRGEDVADDFGPAAAFIDVASRLFHLFTGLAQISLIGVGVRGLVDDGSQ